MSERDRVLSTLAKKIHGKIAGRIVDRLVKVGEANDEQLSQALGVQIEVIRKVLNELYESRIVRYRRVRDEDQGWYMYYWRLTEEYPSRILEERKRKVLDLLKRRLEIEEGDSFFHCPTCSAKYPFSEVADFMYRCPVCNAELEVLDNSVVVEKLKRAIQLLERVKFE